MSSVITIAITDHAEILKLKKIGAIPLRQKYYKYILNYYVRRQ